MEQIFNGGALRLVRSFHARSLDQVAERVEKTRQYIHKIEVGQATPTPELVSSLALSLDVEPEFFLEAPWSIADDQVHFRKLFTTRSTIKQVAMAKAEIFSRLVNYLDRELKLPDVNIPVVSESRNPEDVERAAEICRKEWGLGLGPISNMTRLAETIGAVVTSFKSISREVDALSVIVRRPIFVRNDAKESACRQRYDIGHEIGHCVLHQGQVTGDRTTESEANRFSGALLVPRSMMLKLFPKPRGSRLDWKGISEFKLTWKISKAAILYRAKQLGLLSDDQYKTGIITLKRSSGQAVRENEDHLIPKEMPEIIEKSLKVLWEKKEVSPQSIAKSLKVRIDLLSEFLGEHNVIVPYQRPALTLVVNQ